MCGNAEEMESVALFALSQVLSREYGMMIGVKCLVSCHLRCLPFFRGPSLFGGVQLRCAADSVSDRQPRIHQPYN